MDRKAIMRRAWAIFREAYRYTGKGGISFNMIGRKCFGSCLREAWAEYRDAKAVAAIPADVKARRIEDLKDRLEDLVWMDNFRQAEAYRVNIEAELSRLSA